MSNQQPLVYNKKASNINYYEMPAELLAAVKSAITETDVVLDLGCGIRPMDYFKPKLHILSEPYSEYVELLNYQNAGDKSVIVMQNNALDTLKGFSENSVDSIFLLDVIEHIEKPVGLKIIAECERVARAQIVIFTPLGFMPQTLEPDEMDAWGLSGGKGQVHVSGWLPDDFDKGWEFHVCNQFHKVNNKNETLDKPYGAFFGVRTVINRGQNKPDNLGKLKIPFSSAFDAVELKEKNAYSNIQIQQLKEKLIDLESQYKTKCNEIVNIEKNLDRINIYVKKLENDNEQTHAKLDKADKRLKSTIQECQKNEDDLKKSYVALKDKNTLYEHLKKQSDENDRKINELSLEVSKFESLLFQANELKNEYLNMSNSLQTQCLEAKERISHLESNIEHHQLEKQKYKALSEALQASYTSFVKSKSIRTVVFLKNLLKRKKIENIKDFKIHV